MRQYYKWPRMDKTVPQVPQTYERVSQVPQTDETVPHTGYKRTTNKWDRAMDRQDSATDGWDSATDGQDYNFYAGQWECKFSAAYGFSASETGATIASIVNQIGHLWPLMCISFRRVLASNESMTQLFSLNSYQLVKLKLFRLPMLKEKPSYHWVFRIMILRWIFHPEKLSMIHENKENIST